MGLTEKFKRQEMPPACEFFIKKNEPCSGFRHLPTEAVNDLVMVSLPGTEDAVGKGLLIGAVGEMLGLETKSSAGAVFLTAFAGIVFGDVIAAIELQPRLIAVDLHRAARFGVGDSGGGSEAGALNHVGMVVAIAVGQGLVIVIDAVTDSSLAAKVHRGAGHIDSDSSGNESNASRKVFRGMDCKEVIID